MKTFRSVFLLTIAALSFSCSPHPVAGVWKTTEDNDYGISKLIVSFEGRADFITTKRDNTAWHCFWGATGKREASLDCSSSTNSEQEGRFILNINDQGLAELRHKSLLVARFTRQHENPAPGK